MSQLAFTYEVASWQVRVHRRLDGPPMGGGMYCPDGHVITCAHVVSPAGQRPDGPVYVSFQHARRHEPIAAVVADNGWWPASGEGELYGDVAVLRLTVPPPQEAAPAPLRWLPEGVKAPHSFHTYGYPQPHVLGGVPMRGTIVGYAGQEWLSLLADPDGQGWRPGFSGSPVWDVQQGGVVGIVVVHDSPRSSGDRAGTDGARNAYAIRMEVLGEYWPALKPKIVRALPTDSERLEDLLEIGPIAGKSRPPWPRHRSTRLAWPGPVTSRPRTPSLPTYRGPGSTRRSRIGWTRVSASSLRSGTPSQASPGRWPRRCVGSAR